MFVPLLRRLVGHFAILAFLALSALPPAIGADVWWSDDAACGPSELGPRHAATQFEVPTQSATTTHCTFCHLIRAAAGANAVSGALAAVVLSPLPTSRPAPVARYAHAAVDRQSLRAPPASLSL